MDLYKMGLRPTSPTRPITPDCSRNKHHPRFGMWWFQNLFHRDGSPRGISSDHEDMTWQEQCEPNPPKKRACSSARPVGIGLPRQATFKRQNSEKRDRLLLNEASSNERRAASTSRPPPKALMKVRSNSVPSPIPHSATSSTSKIAQTATTDASRLHSFDLAPSESAFNTSSEHPIEYDRIRPPRPASVVSSSGSFDDQENYQEDRDQLNHELDTKWILNLSMHFRDKSDREKFFVTFAETPTHWRRVTVSCDYRTVEPGSLEKDLKELQLQRDKSLQIYEAVRESLMDIKFYDTVTNLRLETTNGRLHVHVTEDVNEIIPYPSIHSLHHILSGHDGLKQVRESELSFEAHLSGFVYKVLYKNRPFIKKEIPGPDTVEEFLYEVNALHALQDSKYVIDIEAIVTDETGLTIKGLLINYAERGAVVDLLYDYKGEILWQDRERWARHAVQGLSAIHEEGYVQGDFTLSNIVIDGNNNAQIIDINRRGCPVGWEPPEIAKKITSNQRISMYIGQKSDLYQLGMCLWALAMDDDEPERHDPPLSTQEFPSGIPPWYQEVVRACLSARPRDRLSATDLLRLFPSEDHDTSWSSRSRPVVRIRNEKQYIDPAAAVERDDLERFRHTTPQPVHNAYSPESSRYDPTFTWPQSSNYDRECDSATSEIERPRGRRRVSDNDSELRAQRNVAARPNEHSIIDGVHHNAAPVISISSDGNETHVIDTPDEVPHRLDLATEVDDGDTGENAPPLLPFSPISQQLGTDQLLFPNHSETSDETARNGSLSLFGDIRRSPDLANGIYRAASMTEELTGLGTQLNTSDQGFGDYSQENRRAVSDGLIYTLPSLVFRDSGYDEPMSFGVDGESTSTSACKTLLCRHIQSDREEKISDSEDGSWDRLSVEDKDQEVKADVAQATPAGAVDTDADLSVHKFEPGALEKRIERVDPTQNTPKASSLQPQQSYGDSKTGPPTTEDDESSTMPKAKKKLPVMENDNADKQSPKATGGQDEISVTSKDDNPKPELFDPLLQVQSLSTKAPECN